VSWYNNYCKSLVSHPTTKSKIRKLERRTRSKGRNLDLRQKWSAQRRKNYSDKSTYYYPADHDRFSNEEFDRLSAKTELRRFLLAQSSLFPIDNIARFASIKDVVVRDERGV
jgi:hypothetical protein